ncbi:ABC transporter ATP-binding protein [Curtobacterium sp. RRHDQ10]|uniref:ABC transporter ATP-binding protein n=1 Tax=Curtobacterium phyllosphaerae TaxID=3413379 RepID=UPI003BF119C5
MLALRDVTKRYGRRTVLRSVTTEVHEGAITGLLGPNGAGKSTLLHLVVGLVVPDSGSITMTDVAGRPVDRNGAVGFCPDDLPMAELLTGREYLDLVKGVRGVQVRPVVQDSLLRGLRLQHAADSLIATYSHGMRRKLQLIAALLHAPTVLVLDEPLRGLDPESTAIMTTLLRSYADRGGAVLLSTHDLLAADQLCDRVLVLSDGELRADQAITELRDAERGVSLEAGFLAMTGLAHEAGEATAEFFSGLDALVADRDRA